MFLCAYAQVLTLWSEDRAQGRQINGTTDLGTEGVKGCGEIVSIHGDVCGCKGVAAGEGKRTGGQRTVNTAVPVELGAEQPKFLGDFP